MTDLFTALNYPIKKAPKRIELLGDKTRKPEPVQHIIEFPGGAIELSRLADGSYWAHIIVNRDQALGEGHGIRSFMGEIVGSRVDRKNASPTVIDVDDEAEVTQVALLIKPRGHT